jgi:hypothetical protein
MTSRIIGSLIWLLLLILLISGSVFDIHLTWSLRILTAISIGLTLFAPLQIRFFGFDWGSAPIVYVLYLSMYHLGMAAVLEFFPSNMERFRPWHIAWLDRPGANLAMLSTATSITAFVIGCGIISITQYERLRPGAKSRKTYGHHGEFRFGNIILLVSAALLFGIIVQRGGAALLTGQYLAFRQIAMEGAAFSTSMFLMGIGGVLAIAGAAGSAWVWPLAIFGFMAIPLLITGNRGEVFYPLLTFAILVYRRGFRLPRTVIIATLVGLMVLFPIVAEVRQSGLGGVEDYELQIDPVAGIIEIGSALRPAATVSQWILDGETHLRGASYWLPFERMLGRILPSVYERTDPAFDSRFVATYIRQRTGSAMGYSPIGEAFLNFGQAGPLIVFLITGLLLSYLHIRAEYSLSLAILGAVLFPLINNVRNSFIFVPGQIIGGVVLILISRAFHIRHLQSLLSGRRPLKESPAAREGYPN